MPPFLQPLSHGIHAIDTGFHRPRFDAAFLLVEDGRAAFIDTGPNQALPRLLGALEALGLGRDAVDYVIPTHVHLDHAGGAGALMRALPRAKLVVHPRGARHMIDPSRLAAGARAIYGDAEFERSYGELVPVDAARVVTSEDGGSLALAERVLEFIDTPGHARHHHCIWDARSRGWFSGDTFGQSYREFDHETRGAWIFPLATPTQFEPAAMRRSVQRLLARAPERVFLTHYACVTDVQRLGALLLEEIDEMAALGERLRTHPEREAALRIGLTELVFARLRAHGCRLADERIAELMAIDIDLDAQGISAWLDASGADGRVGAG